jgi:acyl carrier protein
MYELVEPRLRQLVADRLGVEPGELAPEVSLLDDLAADSLDLIDIALCLEGTMGVDVPETALERIRTYGELVEMTLDLLRARRRKDARSAGEPPAVWARVLPPDGNATRALERAGWLTPYTVETLVEDTLRMGRGARLELTLDGRTSDVGLTRVREQFARLAARGVLVSIGRDSTRSATSLPPHAAA